MADARQDQLRDAHHQIADAFVGVLEILNEGGEAAKTREMPASGQSAESGI